MEIGDEVHIGDKREIEKLVKLREGDNDRER